MIAQGLRVLRFANDRILNDTEEVLEKIAKYLSSTVAKRTGNRGVAVVGSTSSPHPSPLPRERERIGRPRITQDGKRTNRSFDHRRRPGGTVCGGCSGARRPQLSGNREGNDRRHDSPIPGGPHLIFHSK